MQMVTRAQTHSPHTRTKHGLGKRSFFGEEESCLCRCWLVYFSDRELHGVPSSTTVFWRMKLA